jgi:hypothetical protein
VISTDYAAYTDIRQEVRNRASFWPVKALLRFVLRNLRIKLWARMSVNRDSSIDFFPVAQFNLDLPFRMRQIKVRHRL